MTDHFLTDMRRTARLGACASLAIIALTTTASADIVARESDVVGLRLGQRIYVDDGSCPAGQIKEITGMRLSAAGIEAERKCVDRKGKR